MANIEDSIHTNITDFNLNLLWLNFKALNYKNILWFEMTQEYTLLVKILDSLQKLQSNLTNIPFSEKSFPVGKDVKISESLAFKFALQENFCTIFVNLFYTVYCFNPLVKFHDLFKHFSNIELLNLIVLQSINIDALD